MARTITLFTIPKPFIGHVRTIQRNALQSWTRLSPTVEVVLYGDELGLSETAGEFAVKHVSGVPKNELGTPLLDWAFNHAAAHSERPVLCYVNSDIVLLKDFLLAANRLHFSEFLMVGQRWNWDFSEELDFSSPDADTLLAQRARIEGTLQPPFGSDYFLFPRGIRWDLPGFAVGRPGWDNWLIYRARSLGIPVVDATPAVTAIHQNHDYSHVPSATGGDWEGVEADQNRHLAGGADYLFGLSDATYELHPGKLRHAWSSRHLRRRVAARGLLNRRRT